MPARFDDSLFFLPASPRGSCFSQQCWDPLWSPHVAGTGDEAVDEWGTGESSGFPLLSPHQQCPWEGILAADEQLIPHCRELKGNGGNHSH